MLYSMQATWVHARVVPWANEQGRRPLKGVLDDGSAKLFLPGVCVSRLARTLFAGFILAGLAVATSPRAEDTRIFRVAVLSQVAKPPPGNVLARPIKKSLEDLGYVEGRNLVLEPRYAAGDASRFVAFASDVIALKPDVIIAETTPGALAAKAATTTIPIVFYNVTDPIGTGIVSRIAHPGGNVTGISDAGTECAVKALEMLHEIVPSASRIAVLMSDNPVHAVELRELRNAAAAMHIVLVTAMATTVDELEAAFAGLRGSDAMIMLGGPPFSFGSISAYRRLAEFQQRERLPIACPDFECIRAGGLIAYWPAEPFRAVAAYVDKILRGTPPGDLPVQLPTKFALVLNIKSARQMGLVISPALRLAATTVIQ
jgi:putative ABC transport system substrate-binding protein